MAEHRQRPTVTVALIWVFLPLVSGTGLLVAWLDGSRSRQLLTEASGATLAAMVGDLRANWARSVDPRLVARDLDWLAAAARGRGRRHWQAQLPGFQRALADAPLVDAYAAGLADGSQLRVSRLPLPAGNGLLVEARNARARPPEAIRLGFDGRLRPLALPPAQPGSGVGDPRPSPWYRLALGAGGHPVLSPVQHRVLGGGPGVTLSRSLDGGGGAVAASVLLRDLQERLERFRLTPGTQLALVDAEGRPLLSVGRRLTVMEALRPLLERVRRTPDPYHRRPALEEFRAGGAGWFGSVVGIPGLVRGGGSFLVVAVPEQELLAGPRRALRDALLLTLLLVAGSVPLVVLVARRLSLDLRQLAGTAAAIRGFAFDGPAPPRSWVREVDELATTFDAMRETIRTFLQSAAALGAEPDVERLLRRLLQDAIATSGALGGELLDPQAAAAGSGTAAEDPRRLRLPLRSRDGGLQGVLELRFAEPPDAARVAFCSALSGTAAVALETRSLIAAQKALFQAFIELIAAAIDAKSPYTGGHCARVPELARMLAQAACEADSGAYADFKLSEAEWEALHIGAWLHDCGKITTPEYVVDKATKLETLHNRIHEVRLRFELLKAAAETAYWRGLAEGGDPVVLGEQLATTRAGLDADFAFVAACNQGGEAMAPADLERLERIARRPWIRTLDDRLGLSQDELRRCADEPVRPLPCEEPLLADRPRHRIPRPPQQRRPADNPWGFTMAEPALLTDRGELHNLGIQRGTLTAEERYTINEHIIQTIRMLAALPFPDHLRAVPEIAGSHHERIDGRGYPRGLRGEQMGPLARMMAIADVFEALTAADRPYKSGKPLSVAVAIMAAMVRDGHLDGELFALFLRSGCHRRYAERFLTPEQIDAVDVEALLGAPDAPAGTP